MKLILKIFASIVVILFLGSFFLKDVIFLNIFTNSLPQGIYIRSEGEITRGKYAKTCLTTETAAYGLAKGYLTKGFCETGIMPVGKEIIGIPGDSFEILDNKFVINGHEYKIFREDSVGRPLKAFYDIKRYVLKPGQYILMSNYVENSWDSRYWGPVSVECLIKPLVVVNAEKRF